MARAQQIADITIIGAGIAGFSVAAELADRGKPVRLVDVAGEPGPHHCSWWAGGMLAPWCERESAEELVATLGVTAADWWEQKGVPVTRNGSLVLALGRDRNELARFGRKTSHFEEVDGARIAELEPDLEGQASKGLFFESEAHLAPRQALEVLRNRLSDRHIHIENQRIENVDAYAADHPDQTVIDCRGLAARDRLAELRGVKGEMLVISCPDISLSRPVRLLHPRIPLYIVPRGDGVFMLGATQIESSNRSRITARSMLELLSSAYALNPAFGEAEILEIGVDARPAFPDNLPRIMSERNILSVNGLYRHGFLLAPALARMVAEHVCEQTAIPKEIAA